MSYISLVEEFHAAFRYRYPTPQAPLLKCKETNALRPRLLREELNELREGITQGNRVEQLDALCDLQYVLSGAVLAWGLRGLYESLTYPQKPRPIHDLDSALFGVGAFIDQIEECATLNLPAQLMTAISVTQGDLFRLVHHLGFSDVFADAFYMVHANNLDKYWQDDERVKYLAGLDDSEPRYQFEHVHGKGYIARREDMKIQKPPHHRKVNLSSFI